MQTRLGLFVGVGFVGVCVLDVAIVVNVCGVLVGNEVVVEEHWIGGLVLPLYTTEGVGSAPLVISTTSFPVYPNFACATATCLLSRS
jgi:hypothetical protein